MNVGASGCRMSGGGMERVKECFRQGVKKVLYWSVEKGDKQ